MRVVSAQRKRGIFLLLFTVLFLLNISSIKAAGFQSEVNGEWESWSKLLTDDGESKSKENIWDECEEQKFSIIDLDMDGKLEMIRKGKYKNKDGERIGIYYYDDLNKSVKQIGVIENNTCNTEFFFKKRESIVLCSTYKSYTEYRFYSISGNSIIKKYSITIELSDDLVEYHYKKDGQDILLLRLSYEEWNEGNWNDETVSNYLGELQTVEFENILERYVNILVDGKEYGSYLLRDDQELNIGGTNVCKIEAGVCKMIEAECPKQLCISQGSIQNEGECIICLPNKIIIEIVSDIEASDENEVDTVVY